MWLLVTEKKEALEFAEIWNIMQKPESSASSPCPIV